MRHYRIDQDHSNAYAAWKQMGSPQNPTPEQYTRLESAGQLQLLGSPSWINNDAGKVNLNFALPRQGISLVELSW
jgi:xylan 1,4-beta-xylosidase